MAAWAFEQIFAKAGNGPERTDSRPQRSDEGHVERVRLDLTEPERKASVASPRCALPRLALRTFTFGHAPFLSLVLFFSSLPLSTLDSLGL